MKTFDNIKFHGTFREYQQRVLNSCNKYLNNNKIHIVAAPGSGKTILGIELIKRLNAPCIVLSPTNTIRYQWGERFADMFLGDNENIDDYVSYDLNNLRPITSITYQALHSCINKIQCKDEDNNIIDYSNIDLFKLIKTSGIKTICLDEAHHLKNEWQKALDYFINGLKGVKIIALTATPPYDASPAEWNRYIDTCGEIDEEIFVTELVKCKNLCPHQDYIYFNYPTQEESVIINKYKENINLALKELKESKLLINVPLIIYKQDKKLYDNTQVVLEIIGLLKKINVPLDEKIIEKLFKFKNFPDNLVNFENALNFMLNNDKILSPTEKNEILKIFKKHKLVYNNKINISDNEKINNALIYSLGKLESIANIVKCEYGNLKNELRMLILTDFIKKNDVDKINSSGFFKDISVVSIFQTIRQTNPNINIGILSGSLVILPSNLENDIRKILGNKSDKLKISMINDSDYSEYQFSISNKEKVAITNQLFESGKINIIIGTRSLLGEGWDSPCINSLIMASYVGSFMLSNQMRGRAIRVFKNNPNKTANIWHLVTLEPFNAMYNNRVLCNEEMSSDYKTLLKRFDCFVGPHYSQKTIESGIERISLLQRSYTQESVKKINTHMENLATDRASLFNKWQIENSGIMYLQTSIPKAKTPHRLALFNTFSPTLILFLLLVACNTFISNGFQYSIAKFLMYTLSIILTISLAFNIYKILMLSIPKLFILSLSKGIKSALEKIKLISTKSKIKITNNKQEKSLNISLISDNMHEQKIFLNSLTQFLSPIKQSRYILCKTFLKMKIYRFSFQMPKILATNKKIANMTMHELKMFLPAKLIYNTSKNRKIIYMCETSSNINNTDYDTKIKLVLD